MTNANIPHQIISALNDFEQYGLNNDITVNTPNHFNTIYKSFENLRGDISKYFEPKPIQYYNDTGSYFIGYIDEHTNPDFIGNTINSILEQLYNRGSPYYQFFQSIGNDILIDHGNPVIDLTNDNAYKIGLLHFAITQLSDQIEILKNQS